MSAHLLAGRYELGAVIGKGRSAVYSARDTRLGREVAVKRVGLATGPDEVDDVRSRALREARAAARMSSSQVVGVYDLIDEADAVWLVMELVRAPSLEALVRRQGPLPAPQAAAIGLGVVDALAAAHAVGVLHRDVKPANVLVHVHADGGVSVKLADFGVAVLRDESGLTMPGLVVGSPSYMAPEQASGREVGPEVDLWALGALLYFAVEGVPPFSAGSALATATAVVHGAPRPHHHPGVLSPVIDALLVKDPARRPELDAVRAALQAIAATPEGADPGPVATQPAAAVDRPGQGTTGRLRAVEPSRPRRRRVALVAAAAAALLGAAASQVVGLGTDPARPGPPAADAQPAPDPAAAGPETTEAPAPSRPRHAAPEPAPAVEPGAEPADQETGGAGVTAAAGAVPGPSTTVPASTTTLPDETDPPDTTAPTTTTTSAPPTTEDTTPPTTAQPGG